MIIYLIRRIIGQCRLEFQSRMLIPSRQLTTRAFDRFTNKVCKAKISTCISVNLILHIFELLALRAASHDFITLLAPVVLVVNFKDRLAVFVDIVAVLGEEGRKLIAIAVV